MKMQNLQYIKNLTVDTAKYLVSDERNNAELIVNYSKNTYLIVEDELIRDDNFRNELEQFARGLLARKHAVNLAKREQFL